jgi:hypothetical protein
VTDNRQEGADIFMEKPTAPADEPGEMPVEFFADDLCPVCGLVIGAGCRLDPPADNRADRIARRFHEAYERLAPAHGYETRKASAVPWDDVPEQNKALMRAVIAELLATGTIRVTDNQEEA